jgi:hypothetical protein
MRETKAHGGYLHACVGERSSLMVKFEPYERGMVKTNIDLGVWVHGEPGVFTTSPT